MKRESARWLLDHDDIVDVEAPVDEAGDDVDFFVSFSDAAACGTFEDLMAESLRIVAGHPGVERAVHEDRELFVNTGPSVEPTRLQSELHSWWRGELSMLARDPSRDNCRTPCVRSGS